MLVLIFDRTEHVYSSPTLILMRVQVLKWIRMCSSPNAHLYSRYTWLSAGEEDAMLCHLIVDEAQPVAAGRTDRVPILLRPVRQPVRQPQSVLWTSFCLRSEPHRAALVQSSIFTYLNAVVKSLPPAQHRLPCISTAHRSSSSQ